MKFREWLPQQVKDLQVRIAEHPVFVSATPATSEELLELRKLITLYRFLQKHERERPLNERELLVRELESVSA